jgi:pimeloyl-ACP methyl ester carboxylesterase
VLSHNRISLALHEMQAGSGRPLLLLHGLGEHTPADVPVELGEWPGPIWGLDFTGHGCSTLPEAGGYTCELLLADADIALAHLGEATIFGCGLGGYVGLLLAGTRPGAVRGAIVADGPGLAGGGPSPSTVAIVTPDGPSGGPPDPYALHELSRDARATDYAVSFVREAVEASGLEAPVVVTASARPAWLAAVVAEKGVAVVPTAAEALRSFAVSG